MAELVKMSGQVYEIRALSSATRATAKALLAHPSLLVHVDSDTIQTMSEAAMFQLPKTPSYRQTETQQRFHPEFERLMRGEHNEFKPWRVRFWRDHFNVEFFNYADPNTYARGATDLLCTIPYSGHGGIDYCVDAKTELAEGDIQNIVLQYGELCRHNGVWGKVDFTVGDWRCNDSFKSVNMLLTPPSVQDLEEKTPADLATGR